MKNFILIDEIQYLENPSNFLKYFYDEYKGRIKIIASGSSAFYIDKKFKDSLAGRKKLFYVFTLSFKEFLRFKGEDKLSRKDLKHLAVSELEKIILYYQEYMRYGGYPKAALAPLGEKEDILRDLAYSYIKKDIYEANIHQDEVFYKLFKILAHQTGNLVNSAELASTLGVSRTAVNNYLYVMQKSFHIQMIKPFSKNAKKELTKMPKVYFLDLGLRNFFTKNFNVFLDRQDKGGLLENAVYRELVNNNSFDDIKFWRTAQGHEVDFIIGEETALEVKSNPLEFKKSKYQVFLKNYPEIKFSIVSFDIKTEQVGSFKVLQPWEIFSRER